MNNKRLTKEQQDLATMHYKLVFHAANRFTIRFNLPYDNVFDACTEALIKAVRNYDITRGFTFSTFYYKVAFNRVRKINEALLADVRLANLKAISIYTPLATSNKNGDKLTIIDLLQSNDNYNFINVEQINTVWNLLSNNEKFCITRAYFENKIQIEIAAELGCTQTHVSRLIRNGLGKMRKHLEAVG